MTFFIQKQSVYALPILHYTMEMAVQVKLAFESLQPDCVVVELPEPLQKECLHAAARLPDISVIQSDSLYYLSEPCDASFEGLRSALERGVDAYCIDLDVESYPSFQEPLPDAYSITHIGLEKYYKAYQKSCYSYVKHPLDIKREIQMARRLKELSYSYDKILFIGGMHHIASILEALDLEKFETFEHAPKQIRRVATVTEDSKREIMAEYGSICTAFEHWRQNPSSPILDRQKLVYTLFKEASKKYHESTGNAFLGYHLKNTMKFVRNYSLVKNKLMPNLFQILAAAKGCVDHNYAHAVWSCATEYPFHKNLDNLEELPLTAQQVWGNSKQIHFHLKQKSSKAIGFQRRKTERSDAKLTPPSPFSICSHPPEDSVIENFGEFLKKKGNLALSEQAARTVPFSTSLEDGIDTRETIRHLFEKKLYVKVNGKPPGAAGSVVVIFDEDSQNFPWSATWHGEHNQESDMAFYGTNILENIVGPGISRCEYGGFMMSYPPGRLYDVWRDPDYASCQSKSEVLLRAAIEYALKPIIVYVAEKPPKSKMKRFANRFGKKIVYIPLGSLSQIMLNKIRVFHVLDGHDKREIAGDYIF